MVDRKQKAPVKEGSYADKNYNFSFDKSFG